MEVKFKEVSLIFCTSCGTVQVSREIFLIKDFPITQSCYSIGCNQFRPFNALCIDFMKRRFVILNKE